MQDRFSFNVFLEEYKNIIVIPKTRITFFMMDETILFKTCKNVIIAIFPRVYHKKKKKKK